MKQDLDALAQRCIRFCEARGWRRDWSSGGCYLHLEASEFIEALRGKGDADPIGEAGDVLFVLLSMMVSNGVSIDETVTRLYEKMEKMDEARRSSSYTAP